MPTQVLVAWIDGREDLERMLAKLPQALADQVLVEGLTRAVAPVAATARRLAPSAPPQIIRRSIKVGRMKYGRKHRTVPGDVTIVVRAASRLAHLIEYGTGPRYTRGGAYRGHMPAKPFMRPAWQQNSARIMGDLSQFMWQALIKKVRQIGVRASQGKPIGRF